MNDNYPPGVTGNEPEIVGEDETIPTFTPIINHRERPIRYEVASFRDQDGVIWDTYHTSESPEAMTIRRITCLVCKQTVSDGLVSQTTPFFTTVPSHVDAVHHGCVKWAPTYAWQS